MSLECVCVCFRKDGTFLQLLIIKTSRYSCFHAGKGSDYNRDRQDFDLFIFSDPNRLQGKDKDTDSCFFPLPDLFTQRSSSSHLLIQIFHLAGHIFIFEFPHIGSAFLDAFVSSGGTFQRLTQGVSHPFHVVRSHV